jgi:hypothetical protein
MVDDMDVGKYWEGHGQIKSKMRTGEIAFGVGDEAMENNSFL